MCKYEIMPPAVRKATLRKLLDSLPPRSGYGDTISDLLHSRGYIYSKMDVYQMKSGSLAVPAEVLEAAENYVSRFFKVTILIEPNT
jgi:hypothetical protein